MKAVLYTQYGPPEVLQIQEIPKPVPKDTEVLIKICASSVTAADYKVRGLIVPPIFKVAARMVLGWKGPKKPILGMELSGTIIATGSKVTLLKEGDEVFASTLHTFGAYAEYICLDEKDPIALKPSKLPLEEAAALPIGARTALHYLSDLGNLRSGQEILVYGASGSVGTYAIQLAKYFGAKVTGVCSAGNMELMKSLGANTVIDYTGKDHLDSLETYDIIFDTVDKCPFPKCKEALKKRGTYLNIGRPAPSFEMIWTALTSKKRIIVGETSKIQSKELWLLKRIVENEGIKPVIDRCYDMDHIAEAHRYVEKGHKKGNVLIYIDSKAIGV